MKFMYLPYFYVWANFETMLRDDNAKNQNAIDSIQINYMKVSQMWLVSLMKIEAIIVSDDLIEFF